jgi:hypothetical protein
MSVARTRCRSACAKDRAPPRRHADRAGGHRCGPLERGRPGSLERGPGRAQAVRICGAPDGATGETAVEFGVDERSHVDAVHAQGASAIQEPRCVDVSSLHIDATHHDTGQAGLDEPGAGQVRAGEFRFPQLVGPLKITMTSPP